MSKDLIKDLDIHESVWVNDKLKVTKVFRGWIYTLVTPVVEKDEITSVFVPGTFINYEK